MLVYLRADAAVGKAQSDALGGERGGRTGHRLPLAVLGEGVAAFQRALGFVRAERHLGTPQPLAPTVCFRAGGAAHGTGKNDEGEAALESPTLG
jgi:hypothetical protein